MSNMSFVQSIRQSQRQQQRLSIIVRWIIAVILILFAVFPVLWIISAAFNPADTLATQTLIPRNAGLDNFTELFNSPVFPYWTW